MLLCIAAFTLFALPVGHGVGTEILVRVFHAPQRLAAIRTVDEAIVIAAALSLSSSAFVLQLLAERGELASKFGSATLGILLLQVCWTGWLGLLWVAAAALHCGIAAWLPRRAPATFPSVPLPDCDLRLQYCSVGYPLQPRSSSLHPSTHPSLRPATCDAVVRQI